MRPKRIILIRHGESEGNADKRRLEVIPDYVHGLTAKGVEQADAAANKIHKIIGNETVHAYVTPWHRTRQTFAKNPARTQCHQCLRRSSGQGTGLGSPP